MNEQSKSGIMSHNKQSHNTKEKKRKANPNIMATLYPDIPNEDYTKIKKALIEEQIIMKAS